MKKYILGVTLFLSSFLFSDMMFAQTETLNHIRGMIWQTVYNEGTLGRPHDVTGIDQIDTYSMMYPPHSRATIEGIEYDGQMNDIGGGLWIGANPEGVIGTDVPERYVSLSGGAGRNSPAPPIGRWSFPIEFQRILNYPLLEDGSLNPNYDPNEAEEIIVAKWATNSGITVTRTSRAWSYPDYNDFIIYEYELENTGNTDSNPNTIEREVDLEDVLVAKVWSMGPSMLGFQRFYNEWRFGGGMMNGNNRIYWDWDYWMKFTSNVIGQDDDMDLGRNPEPDPALFYEWAETGKNGGGLLSPQSVGFAALHYNKDNLAFVSDDPTITESHVITEYEALPVIDSTATGEPIYLGLDEDGKVKQPWNSGNWKGFLPESAAEKGWIRVVRPKNNRKWQAYTLPNDVTDGYYPNRFTNEDIDKWAGRSVPRDNTSQYAVAMIMSFGPYNLDFGETIEFSFAQVGGYGADPTKEMLGGLGVESSSEKNTIYPDINRKYVSTRTGETYTEAYLDDFGYPDYIDSEVADVNQVAHKAFEAYLGEDPQLPVWPEDNPEDGVYTIPAPYPAPVITVTNTQEGNVKLQWKRSAENFTHPRLQGESLDTYNVYRSDDGLGWELITSLSTDDLSGNEVEILDSDPEYKVGEVKYYSVTSVSNIGEESGRSNVTRHEKRVGPVEEMDQVYVVPNPFVVESGFTGGGEVANQIGFYGLPERCTIRIFSFDGQLVKTIEHNDESYSTAWLQVTRNDQALASGMYFYLVKSPDGNTDTGKFIIIK
jgi:hypothetical protein